MRQMGKQWAKVKAAWVTDLTIGIACQGTDYRDNQEGHRVREVTKQTHSRGAGVGMEWEGVGYLVGDV